VDEEIARLEKFHIGPTKELEELLDAFKEKLPPSGISLASLIRRPRVTYESLAPFDPERPQLSKEIIEQVEINIKYEGYIKRQLKQIEEFKKSEGRALPENLDYSKIKGMRTEAIEKLSHIRPNNIGMASRVSGVSPADMAALMLHLERRARGI
jgi:tRNA uridine 5-carboxymethylaminomethyl modification enzyme